VVMIKIWLQAKYESKKFEHPSIFWLPTSTM
jgi:hypothetical protein